MMSWNGNISIMKFVLLLSVEMMMLSGIMAQQGTGAAGWQTYSPSGAAFSMQVPSTPLHPQGHIFDPKDNERVYRLAGHDSCARAYNFEINKKGKRSFFVSILEIQYKNRSPNSYITDSEAEGITATIGDDIVRSKIERQMTVGGETSQWTYKRKGDVESDDEDDGVVHVRRWGTYMVIVVVDYDYASAGDVDVKVMLESLRMK